MKRYDTIEDMCEIGCSVLNIKTELGRESLRIALKNIQVLDRKNQDYGSANIQEFGQFGLLIRINDKIARLKNLFSKNKNPKNESVRDSFLDLANYAIIAATLEDSIDEEI